MRAETTRVTLNEEELEFLTKPYDNIMCSEDQCNTINKLYLAKYRIRDRESK